MRGFRRKNGHFDDERDARGERSESPKHPSTGTRGMDKEGVRKKKRKKERREERMRNK